MPKVLLINPPWSKSKDNIWNIISSVNPPIGLASIASYLQMKNIDVKVLDMQALRMTTEELTSQRDICDYHVIGITCTTLLSSSAYNVVNKLREIVNNDVQIVLGGPHPTVCPDEAASVKGVDCVVRSEGEITLYEIVIGKDKKNIRGISYHDSNKIIHNESRPLIKDINALPMPAYDILPMHLYRPALGAFKKLPGIGIITSRGCPGKCTFCYNSFGKTLRLRSADNIFDEIVFLKSNHGIKEISFYDDTFTASKDRIKQLCQRLISTKTKISWSCFSRVDCINEELLRIMKSAGCHQIMYGIESANNEILKNINKKINIEQVLHTCDLTKQAGIDIRAAFMIGNPGETKSTIEETFRLALKIEPDILLFNITTPYPGTEMFKLAKKNGWLITENWDHYDLARSVMKLPTISPEEIKVIYHDIYRKFYLRPARLIKDIKRLLSLSNIVACILLLSKIIQFKNHTQHL